MTDSFKRIEKEFEAFRSKVAHCLDETGSDISDIRDAYERFYNLRERYDYEKQAGTLSPTEEAALRKEFDENKIIVSVVKLRGISAHVETGDVELLDPDKISFTLTAISSAAALVAARSVNLTDKQGQIQRINHLRWLRYAVARIDRAIMKAKGI